jgi:hypothetical protein
MVVGLVGRREGDATRHSLGNVGLQGRDSGSRYSWLLVARALPLSLPFLLLVGRRTATAAAAATAVLITAVGTEFTGASCEEGALLLALAARLWSAGPPTLFFVGETTCVSAGARSLREGETDVLVEVLPLYRLQRSAIYPMSPPFEVSRPPFSSSFLRRGVLDRLACLSFSSLPLPLPWGASTPGSALLGVPLRLRFKASCM